MKLSSLFLVIGLAAGTLWPGAMPCVAQAQEAQPPAISFGAYKSREENIEGPDAERTYFLVGTKRIAFGVPKDCRFSVDGNGFTLITTEPGLDGTIRVGLSPFSPELDLAENVSRYREAAAEQVPRGSTEINAQPPVMNPYPYNGWSGLCFGWDYSFYGRPLHRTTSYVNLETGVQIIVTVESAQAGAGKAEKMAQQFMRSWWVMRNDAEH